LVTAASDPAITGDEPLVLARHTACPIAVSSDRVAAARFLVAQGCDVIVSDDGLQHYRLQRDIEIAVVDGQAGLGNSRLLPAGPLRETADRLQEVNFVLTKGGSVFPGDHRFDLLPQAAINLHDQESRKLADFSGQEVWAIAGIGHPEHFVQMLSELGICPELVGVSDHGVTDIDLLLKKADYPILMTEKDAVKYSADTAADIWYVPVDVKISEQAVSSLEKAFSELSNCELPSS
jgi:tetraacyldisaccharide 4'-kinase